ncbi:MAG: molecular chaperone TorD family protein [Desulfobulbaceae bacterium]|nr:molecular chaperone TorD family protein [Desulfobulbaceae bacterium]
MLEELQEELKLYKLLNQLFLPDPSKDLLLGLAIVSLPERKELDEFSIGLKLLVESIRKNENRLEAWQEDLATEYARIFIGPKSPPAVPFASFYLSGTRALMTEETVAVRKKYLERGMAVKQLYQIPDDHIAIELEFLYYLTNQAIEAYQSGQTATAEQELDARNDFIISHFVQWVPMFADKIIQHAEYDFYKGAAQMLKATVTEYCE